MRKLGLAIILAFVMSLMLPTMALAEGGWATMSGALHAAGTDYAGNAAAAHASGLTTGWANQMSSGALSNYASNFANPPHPSIPFVQQGVGYSQGLSDGMQVSYTGQGTYWVQGAHWSFNAFGHSIDVGLGYSYATGVTDAGAQFLQTNAMGSFLAALGYGPAASMDAGFSSLFESATAGWGTMLGMALESNWSGLASFLSSGLEFPEGAATRLSPFDMLALVAAANQFTGGPNWMSALYFSQLPDVASPDFPPWFSLIPIDWGPDGPPEWPPDWPLPPTVEPPETPIPTAGPETPVPTQKPPATPEVPEVPECPAPQLILSPPSFGEVTIQPPYPIVVGQDPEKRGVDFIIPAYGGSATWRWWELVIVIDEWHEECHDVWDEDESRFREKCRRVIDEWHWECRAFEETYEDPVAEIGAKVELDGGSVSWIEGEMAQRFPGAHVYASYPVGLGGHSAGLGSMEATFYAPETQLQDPGLYHMNARVNTTGTPMSAPQTARTEEDFEVWLRDETLTY